MTKKHLFFLLTILLPVIFVLSYCWNDLEWENTPPKKGPSRPMVELTDAELNKVFGQAGIQYINDHFNFQFTVDEVTTVNEFQNQLLNYMNHLQETNPEQAMNTYVDMINTVNAPLNPNIIPGPNVTHIQIDLNHAMEHIIAPIIIAQAQFYSVIVSVDLERQPSTCKHIICIESWIKIYPKIYREISTGKIPIITVGDHNRITILIKITACPSEHSLTRIQMRITIEYNHVLVK